jgi:aryl-alcohol dehydrogenase-like predicted oxidoreductase
MSSPVKLIFGTHTIPTFPVEVQKEFFSILKEYGIKDLDTAYIYAGSEQALGDIGAAKAYAIHTKAPGFAPGSQKKDSIIATANESLKRLGVDQVDTYFLHSPDPETHIEDTLEGVQEVYKSGKFKHVSHPGLKDLPYLQ